MNDEDFAAHAGTIAAMVIERREHVAEGVCREIACMGPAAILAMREAAAADPRWLPYLVRVAITLLADSQSRIDELERAIEIQRGLTADSAAAAMRLDADLVDGHGQVAGLELRVSSLLAELTLREDSAGVIGPVLPVAEHE